MNSSIGQFIGELVNFLLSTDVAYSAIARPQTHYPQKDFDAALCKKILRYVSNLNSGPLQPSLHHCHSPSNQICCCSSFLRLQGLQEQQAPKHLSLGGWHLLLCLGLDCSSAIDRPSPRRIQHVEGPMSVLPNHHPWPQTFAQCCRMKSQ